MFRISRFSGVDSARRSAAISLPLNQRRARVIRAAHAAIEYLENRVLLSITSASISGAASVVEGATYTLNLSATSTGTVNDAQIDWGDGTSSSPDVQTISGNPSSATHVYAGGNYSIAAKFSDNSGSTWTTAGPLNGQLDATFGTSGIVSSVSGSSNAVAISQEGLVADAGGSAVTVYNADGSIDTSFGSSGTASVSGTVVAAQYTPADSLLIASANSGNFVLSQYASSGSLDSTFGTNSSGTVSTSFSSSAVPLAMAVFEDGSILVSGNAGSTPVMARYLSTGALDTTFGSSGKVTSAPSGWDTIDALYAESDGSFLAGGYTAAGGWAVAHFNANGTMDTAFGTSGVATLVSNWGQDRPFGLMMDSNGQIVAATAILNEITLARLNPDGTPDTTFSSTGIVDASIYTGASDPLSTQIQSDDKLVIGMTRWPDATHGGGNGPFSVVRFNPDGTLDDNFGIGGIYDTPYKGDTNKQGAVDAQANGQVIIAANDTSYAHQVVVRLLTNNTVEIDGAIQNLSAASVSTSEIALSWTVAATNASDVQITRSTDGVTYTAVSALSASTTSYMDTGLSPGTEYTYQVCVTLPLGLSSSSAVVAGTVGTAPTSLSADGSGGYVGLSWNEGSADIIGFNIYRSSDGVHYTQIDSIPADPTSNTYEDGTAPAGVVEYYQMTSVSDGGGESAPSSSVSSTLVDALQLSDDTYNGLLSVAHGQSITIGQGVGGGVLSNDFDPNGRSMQIGSHTAPAHGTLTLNSDGTFTYTANESFVGTDSFTYAATDNLAASSNTATVSIVVTDDQPIASSGEANVGWQYNDGSDGYGDGYGGGYGDGYGDGYGGSSPSYSQEPISGQLYASADPNSTLTYSVGDVPSSDGSLSLDPSTGAFTFTPDSSFDGVLVIPWHVNDGAMDSNVASLVIAGWSYDSNGGGPDQEGDGITYAPSVMPYESRNYQVYENQSLQGSGNDLLNGSSSQDLHVDSVVDGPHHGSVNYDAMSGDFTYTPTAGYVGPDTFSYQVYGVDPDTGAHITGGYVSALINVVPMAVGISAAGGGEILVPQEPAGSTTPPVTDLYLQFPTDLPAGSTITLSSNDASDIQIWQGVPYASGSIELIGGGTFQHIFTIGSDTPATEDELVGVDPTEDQQVDLTVCVCAAPEEVGEADDAPAAPATQQATTKPAAVQGTKGRLVALDGTGDDRASNTVIVQFMNKYKGDADPIYKEGVASKTADPNPTLNHIDLIGGDRQAFGFEQAALGDVINYYLDVDHQKEPLDVIGYSRGAFEASRLLNDLAAHHLPQGYKPPPRFVYPTIIFRFVGLVSPVMGPEAHTDMWPETLPMATRWFEALDDQALDGGILDKSTLTQIELHRNPLTRGPVAKTYPLGHRDMGKSLAVLQDTIREAKKEDVPVST